MRGIVFALLAVLFILSACGGKIETNMSEKVQPFRFTTEEQKQLSNKDLEGQWWVADTIFTSCKTVCPPMTRNMAALQKKAKKKDLDVQFVSFSVDPSHDTPKQLKKFGDKFGADYSNWTFLTGYDFKTIKKFSIKSFRNLVDHISGSDQVMHGTSFFLINPEGKVIKKYKGTSNKEMDKIINDLTKVQ
ncbi:SCO family protein [Halobacillus salinarum]|uniref:SCO family protein n=1 Tax=Halobacillus salinarum TaxID=2932257 RepID=A0ABY4EIE3_9BACI|nr:SCO family protein [Halobacillus salinarum]UOQ44245.1 SCO family protein [Halobacillus salinarum]